MISLIIPCFNEQDALPYFYSEICKILDQMREEYELIFVDDGSTDKTLITIKLFAENNENVVYFSLSRNFGKEAAMYAGFCNARGEYVAVMDADMQDPPCLLPEMLHILKEKEVDGVATRRISRDGEPLLRSWFAKQFYKIINRISDADIVDGARDFRLMKKDMVNAIVKMGEYNRFSKGIFGWVCFKTYWISFENVERIAGRTKWNFWKLFKYALDGIINFSQMPLSIASWLEIGMTGVSVIILLILIFRRLYFGDPVAGIAFMSMLIIPSITVGFPLIVLMILNKKSKNKMKIKSSIVSCASWVYGY